MPFNSVAYLLLMLCVLGLMRVPRAGGYVLLLASAVFYLTAGLFDAAVFAGALAGNWLLTRLLPRGRSRMVLAIVGNIGLLALFKYANLLLGQGGPDGFYVDTSLPLGISFYCFQVLAYQIDVDRGKVAPASSMLSFTLFIGFFPQLVAGPIMRASQLLPQIERALCGRLRPRRLAIFGLALCTLGLIKKVVLADSVGPLVDDTFAGLPGSAAEAWLGALLFGFQIYFDFSGYSDIAIGSAYLLGFRLPANFRTPYLSLGPREFWQRWHITLSTWIRDYLYVPLGGGRGSALRRASVLVGVMSVAGLWHGADANFAVWGFGWGLYILFGRVCGGAGVPGWLRWPAHMAMVALLWVFFRAPDLDYAWAYVARMFGSGEASGEGVDALAAAGVAALYALHWLEYRCHGAVLLRVLRRCNSPYAWGVLFGLCALLVLVPALSPNPFIYFRF